MTRQGKEAGVIFAVEEFDQLVDCARKAKSLVRLFAESPLAGLALNLERSAGRQCARSEGAGMQNAHERFGTLEFTKRTKDTTTRVRIHVDRVILEPVKDGQGSLCAHLISMIGGDAEIAALWAAVTEGALFKIQLPGRAAITASLGPEAQCFRGSVIVSGRKRPVRHLVAVSAELAKTKPGADREGARTILCDADPTFVLYRIASRYGLPVIPDWAPWFMRELKQRKAVTPLLGLGCSAVLVEGNKQTFLSWISRALRERLLRIPEQNGSISWKLPRTFLEGLHLERGESRDPYLMRLGGHVSMGR